MVALLCVFGGDLTAFRSASSAVVLRLRTDCQQLPPPYLFGELIWTKCKNVFLTCYRCFFFFGRGAGGSLSVTSGLHAQEEVTFVGNGGMSYSRGVSILALLAYIYSNLTLRVVYVVFFNT